MTAPFPNDPSLPFTLPETLRLAGDRRTWAGLAVVLTVAGLVGPFGTYTANPLPERLAYWGLIVIGTFWIGAILSELLQPRMARLGIAGAAILNLAVAVPITAFVALVALGFGATVAPGDVLLLFANCAALSLAISALSGLVAPGRRPDAPAAPPGPPALLSRLDPARRGALVRLSAQGHYVEVVTTGGRTLLLMRLKDAIAEAAPEPGLRVHRSHWVALRAAGRGGQGQGKPFVRTADGHAVPVSRSMRPLARAKGLL